jgi:hypothetical protein
VDRVTEDNGAFERIVSACVRVEELRVNCERNSQFTALAALLQNPLSMLQILTIGKANEHDADLGVDFDEDTVVSEILESLVGNTKLRELWFECVEHEEDIEEIDFDENEFLCNSTTLQNICNSNHTLEKVWIGSPYYYGKREIMTAEFCCCQGCCSIALNRNENKNIVIQNKVMQFYFVGSFDLAPFASMPLSVLAKVMSVGEQMENKQTAIFELLRGIPELCNVSSRHK